MKNPEPKNKKDTDDFEIVVDDSEFLTDAEMKGSVDRSEWDKNAIDLPEYPTGEFEIVGTYDWIGINGHPKG